jgi:N-acetylmuramoyl-L-alanine amidase
MKVEKIYLHWSATPYDWKETGHYHTVIQGNGNVVRMTPYDYFLGAHTWKRNTNAVGIAIACMGGEDYWNDYPPTDVQIDAMCKETAQLAKDLGWSADDITIQRVMTHAEAASCRDGCYLHENYGPVPWGGDGTRWDLMQLKKGGECNGGDVLREKIKFYMNENPQEESAIKSIEIDCNSKAIGGLLYSNMSTYAQIHKLASAYGFETDWNPEKRRVYVFGENMPLPKYVKDDLGLNNVPKVDVCSRNGNIIMSGFLNDGHAYVKVLEFANEFNIPIEVVEEKIKLGSFQNYGG